MILGVGIDLLDENRIKKIFLKFRDEVLKKILSVEERKIFDIISNIEKKVNFISKRFSAKESIVKAMGIGMGRGLEFKNISILNDNFGRPFVKFDKVAEIFVVNFYKKNIDKINFHISITDEKNLINTIVIIGEKI